MNHADSENFMFKRFGAISGDIMGSSFKVLTGPFKSLALPENILTKRPRKNV